MAGYLESLRQGGARILHGAALPFMDNPSLPSQVDPKTKKTGFEGYSPVAVDMLPALANAGLSLINPDIKWKYGEQASERVMAADQSLRRNLQISDPQNAGDVALEIIGGILVPMPGPKGANAALKGSKAITTGGKVAQAAKGVAKGVAEVAMPLRQTKLSTAVKLAPAVGVGLSEGIDAVADNPEYTGVADQFRKAEHTNQPAVDPIDQQIDQIYGIQSAAPSSDPIDAQIDAVYGTGSTTPTVEQPKVDPAQEKVDGLLPDWVKNPLVVAGTVAGLGLGYHGARALRSMANAKLAGASGELAGIETNPQQVTAAEKLFAGVGQADQPLRNKAKTAMTEEKYKLFSSKLDRTTSSAHAQKVQSTIATGEFPNSPISTKPIGVTLEALAKDITPDEYIVLRDGLLAKSSLDDIGRTGKQAQFNKYTPEQLRIMAGRIDSDPKLQKYAQLIQKHYHDLLDYKADQGLIDSAMYSALRRDRPNYVHMSKAERYEGLDGQPTTHSTTGASERLDEIYRRATDEGAGVQAGATSDPIRELVQRYDATIRLAETNSIRREFFDLATNNKDMSKYIKQVPDEIPGKTHVVYENGVKKYYKVDDPTLDKILTFAPKTAPQGVRGALNAMRHLFQQSTTGILNPVFSTTVSPVYDTMTGIMLRPKDYQLGVANEFINRTVGPLPGNTGQAIQGFIGNLDPTTYLSAPIGAVRYMGAKLSQSVADSISEQLLRQDGWLYNAVGPQKATILRDRIAQIYDNSIISKMEKLGASGASQFSSADPTRIGTSVRDLAPTFYKQQSAQVYADAMTGSSSFYEGLLRGSRSAYEQSRASSIARTYTGLLQAMHEGFRVQSFATNLPKVINDVEGQNILAAQTRRLGADISQMGGAELYQQTADAIPYLNTSVQTLVQLGRQLSKDPTTVMTNTATMLAALMAFQYAGLQEDPERMEELRKTPDDILARRALGPGGVELPIVPELRPIWGVASALVNEISGVNSGYFDPSFASVFNNWLDNDWERGEHSITSAGAAGLKSAMPLNASSFPLANAAAATLGFNMGMSRYTGTPMNIEGQQQSVMGGNGQFKDDVLSARAETVIAELTGATIGGFTRAGLDAMRVLKDGTGSPEQALNVAYSRLVDNQAKSTSPAHPVLFGNYDRIESLNDKETSLMHSKNQGVDKALKALDQLKTNEFLTGTDPRYYMLTPMDLLPPELQSTQLAPIAASAAALRKRVYPLQNQLAQLKDQSNAIKNQKVTLIEDRNMQLNVVNGKRRELNHQILNEMRMAEDSIRQTIGDPSFSFQNFDPEEYAKRPLAPQVPMQ